MNEISHLFVVDCYFFELGFVYRLDQVLLELAKTLVDYSVDLRSASEGICVLDHAQIWFL